MEVRGGREVRPHGVSGDPLTRDQRKAMVAVIEARAERDRERLEREFREVFDLDLFRARAWLSRAKGR